ncbi:MAG: GAF domain-containing protein [bacterium]
MGKEEVNKDMKEEFTQEEERALLLEMICTIYSNFDNIEGLIREIMDKRWWKKVLADESCLMIFKNGDYESILPCIHYNRKKKHCWDEESAKGLFEEARDKGIPLFPDKWYLPEIKSKAIIPLKDSRDKVIGLLNLSSKDKDAFREGDEKIMQIAIHTGIVIGIGNGYKRRLIMLSRVSDELMRNLENPELLDIMVKIIKEILQAEVCSLFLVSEDKEHLELKREYGYPVGKERIFKQTPPLLITDGEKTGLPGYVASTQKTIRLDKKGIMEHPSWSGNERISSLEYLKSGKCFSLMATPIKRGDELLGVLKVENKLDKDGYPEGMKFSIEDEILLHIFSDKIALSLEIADSIRKRKEAEKITRSFIRATSHTLRTPMHTVLDCFDQLEEEKPELEENELFQVLKQETYRFARLAKNLLYLSKQDTKTLRFIKEDFDIGEIIKRIRVLFKRSFLTQKIEFVYIPKGDTSLYADKDALMDVFINLMANSVHAIKWKERGFGKIMIDVKDSNGFLNIEVIDDGVGMDKEFKEAMKEAREKKGRMGLGLRVVKAIIKGHKGKIYLKDNPEGGAIFGFTLPKPKEGR